MTAHIETWAHLHPLIVCDQAKCNKFVHRVCYKQMVANSSTPHPPIKDKVFCNLRHHDAYLKTQKECILRGQMMEPVWVIPRVQSIIWSIGSPVRSTTFNGEILQGHSLSTKYVMKLQICFMARDVASRLTWSIYNKIQHIEVKMRQCYDQYEGTKTENRQKKSKPMSCEDKVLFYHHFLSFSSFESFILMASPCSTGEVHVPFLLWSRANFSFKSWDGCSRFDWSLVWAQHQNVQRQSRFI
jgi:hypothetical protein